MTISEFLDKKKDKAFYSFLKKWFSGKDFSDVVIAKNLTSLLTHCFIEIEFNGGSLYKSLEVERQSVYLNNFILGNIDSGELKIRYKRIFGD